MMFADNLWIERNISQALFATGNDNLNWQQAFMQVEALKQYLSARQIGKVALYFDDAAFFAIALLACVQANIDVYLPSNMAQSNRHWLEQSVDIYLGDKAIDDFATTTLLVTAWPKPVNTNIKGEFRHNINIFMQTSGSTGTTKIIRKYWLDLCKEIEILAGMMPEQVISGQTVVLGSVSVQHMYGLSFRIMLSLYLGLPIYRQQLQFPELLLINSQLQKNVIWVSSPTLLHSFHQAQDLALATSSVKAVISAGGMLTDDCKKFLQKYICPFVLEIYGSTETGVIGYRCDQPYWRALSTVKYTVTEHGISVQSAWCQEEQTVSDVIIEHEHGFELLGRLDRIIKLADKRISLLAIEKQLLSHNWVADVYIVKELQNSHLTAWVALNARGIEQWRRQGRKQIIQSLKSYIAGDVEKIALPRQWRFSTYLPRNTQGKLNQQDIQLGLLQPVTEPILLFEKNLNHDEYEVCFQVPLDLIYFNGHFDQFHLVPGVIQLKWILDFLNKWQWIKEKPHLIENLKFQHFLRPADIVEMHVKRDQIKQKITFSCKCAEQKISSGRLVINHGQDKTL